MSGQTPPICPYCLDVSVFMASSAELYRGRNYGPVYACLPCKAWVGCHEGTERPLGRLADAALRQAKTDAHACLDRLWRAKMKRDGCSQAVARRAAYSWLSAQMGTPPAETHIGMFNLAQCQRVVEVCLPYIKPKEPA